jgi:hypothetical protein
MESSAKPQEAKDIYIHFTCASCGRKLKSHSRNDRKHAFCLCGAKCKIVKGLVDTKEMPVHIKDVSTIEAMLHVTRKGRLSRPILVAMAVILIMVITGTVLIFWQLG